jgi:hypothetical protein
MQRPAFKFSLRSLCIFIALTAIVLVAGIKWHYYHNSRPIQVAVDDYNRQNSDPRLELTVEEVIKSLSLWNAQSQINQRHARQFGAILSSNRMPNNIEFSVLSNVTDSQHRLLLGIRVIDEQGYTIRTIDNGKWAGFAPGQYSTP